MSAARLPIALAFAAVACWSGCRKDDSISPSPPAPVPDGSRVDVSRLKTGPELYQALCSACHGTSGAADGPGAQSLYPPARNLRTHRFRLVSTENHVPTREDIDRVIALGMPGTSMRAFTELSAAQRRLLVDEVLRYRREGEAEMVRKMLRSFGESENDGELQERVRERMTPGRVVVAPAKTGGGREATERGRTLYFRQGCQACHGSDGVGAADLRLLTDEGIPTRGRDLVHEPFKGGHTRESIYLRIALGMPGTPMPASRTLSPQELSDLGEFCLSLSREPKRMLTNHLRAQQATARAYLEAIAK
jgi:mono/diheme cytochrome c family protein